MGRWGKGLFDSEMAWDILSDLTDLAGIALNMIDCPKEDWEDEDIPIMTSEEARLHLNNGNFGLVFDFLKEQEDHYMLLLFIGISMRVGACISKAQLKHVKQIYKKVDTQHFFQFDKQMEYAFREYKCGQPYYLRDFDEHGNLLPDGRTNETAFTTTKDGTADPVIETKKKRKASGEEVRDQEDSAAKRVKV